jgi:hypothetical protein
MLASESSRTGTSEEKICYEDREECLCLSTVDQQVPHQMIFLDDSWMFASGSDSKMWSDDTASMLRKGDQHQGKATSS